MTKEEKYGIIYKYKIDIQERENPVCTGNKLTNLTRLKARKTKIKVEKDGKKEERKTKRTKMLEDNDTVLETERTSLGKSPRELVFFPNIHRHTFIKKITFYNYYVLVEQECTVCKAEERKIWNAEEMFDIFI